MKISLVGYKDNSINIFKDLAKELSKRISGLELGERFAPLPEDLPELTREAAEDSDFIFVFALLEDSSEINMLEEKLIDVELLTHTRVLKAILEDEYGGLDEEEYLEAKDTLVKQYSDLIVEILFNEEAFEPQEKDFSI